MNKPDKEEYNPYFDRYISLVQKGDFMNLLTENTKEIVSFFESIPLEKHNYRYAEGKWSIKDILMHITDTERVMCYRALAAARGDSSTILGNMEEDLYAANVDTSKRALENILLEFRSLRKATEIFFENLGDNQSKFKARTEVHSITARAVGYILIGHPKHHMHIINERYLLK